MSRVLRYGVVFTWLLGSMFFSGCTTTMVEGTVDTPSNKGVAPKNITITGFKGGSRDQGEMLASLIVGELKKEGHVAVVPALGQATLKGALQVGPLQANSWSEEYETEKDGRKQFYRIYYFKADKNISVNYELKLGNQVIGDTYMQSFSDSWSGSSANEARANAPTEKAIDDTLLSDLARKIVQDISPHKVTAQFAFHNGNDSNLGVGIKYVQFNRMDQAMDVFRQVKTQTPAVENIAAATYNMGLICEMRGEFKQAFDLFSEANQLQPGESDYIEALSRAERNFQLKQKFDSQVSRK